MSDLIVLIDQIKTFSYGWIVSKPVLFDSKHHLNHVLDSYVNTCIMIHGGSLLLLFIPVGDRSVSFCSHSFKKQIATSTESLVGFSSNTVSNSNDNNS